MNTMQNRNEANLGIPPWMTAHLRHYSQQEQVNALEAATRQLSPTQLALFYEFARRQRPFMARDIQEMVDDIGRIVAGQRVRTAQMQAQYQPGIKNYGSPHPQLAGFMEKGMGNYLVAGMNGYESMDGCGDLSGNCEGMSGFSLGGDNDESCVNPNTGESQSVPSSGECPDGFVWSPEPLDDTDSSAKPKKVDYAKEVNRWTGVLLNLVKGGVSVAKAVADVKQKYDSDLEPPPPPRNGYPWEQENYKRDMLAAQQRNAALQEALRKVQSQVSQAQSQGKSPSQAADSMLKMMQMQMMMNQRKPQQSVLSNPVVLVAGVAGIAGLIYLLTRK